MQFTIGEVVQLKSGGPKMTVEGMLDSDMGGGVACVWFDKMEAKRGTFPAEVLERC